ncbi:unnamed protein product [Euphydryas editha]|uniref:Endonuclease/exonuclease/phosphatase domain-containing protein n=1 Tax=Euphydryas editha TaxID=104508 RepID=A0AAU9UPS7_EUPED|nr:unnamed protein product [Euphydryas editha]
MDRKNKDMSYNSLVTFNCRSLKRSVEGVRQLCKKADIIALQETWLLPHDLTYLASIDADFGSTGTSAVDTSNGVLVGRPHGGVALLWRKNSYALKFDRGVTGTNYEEGFIKKAYGKMLI